ncbi:GNAT family acetyltransferase [Oceanibacterium hippocampi]|uniref:Acetyltransferase YpeA n=1 Tax=Oceanibacterium hippocampi TaxID=745714 RepID=A0A1Y5SG85_9PROT|nr:GNAT family acetyltransferase [Oceanibacterium hippocampi]SLN36991.1 Acetyltransferase YpeA [Oceanibacterium hippocampi]
MQSPAPRPFRDDDISAIVALWDAAALTRPWNDPQADIALCARNPSSALFVAAEPAGEIVATVMCGFDGHRGWIYYLAVAPRHRGTGLGRRMVAHAEQWLAGLGAPKVELMVRDGNDAARAFYERIGYAVETVFVMSRWLTPRGAREA